MVSVHCRIKFPVLRQLTEVASIVVTGVLTRASIPALHSAAALMRMTDIAAEQASTSTESGGAINVFIKALLDKVMNSTVG